MKDFQNVVDDLEDAEAKAAIKLVTITSGFKWEVTTDFVGLLGKAVVVSAQYASDGAPFHNNMKVASAGAKDASFTN